jgi:hypothetical protein
MSSLRNNYSRITGSQVQNLSRLLTVDGTRDADPNSNVDGTSPVKFWIQPEPGSIYELSQATIEVSDVGNPNLDDYGSIVGPLANGIQFFVELNGVELPFGPALKSNRSLIALLPNFQVSSFSSNEELRIYSLDILTHSKAPIRLNGNTDDKFGIIVRDNLSALSAHTTSVRGNLQLSNV